MNTSQLSTSQLSTSQPATTVASGFISLEDEVIALRAQVRDFSQMVAHQDAKIVWLTRAVYGTKSERRPVAQDLDGAQQDNFLTIPVTAVAAVSDATVSDAVQAAAEQLETQTHTVELSAAQKRRRSPSGESQPASRRGHH